MMMNVLIMLAGLTLLAHLMGSQTGRPRPVV